MQRLTDFAIALYQQPDVAPACLNMQNEQGCPVPVLLAYCWHACCIGPLPEQTAIAWMTHDNTRLEQAIVPLRQARTWMKSHWPAAKEIRENIKQAELQLEICLLRELEGLANDGQATALTEENREAQIQDTLQAFARRYNLDIPWVVETLLIEQSLNCLVSGAVSAE